MFGRFFLERNGNWKTIKVLYVKVLYDRLKSYHFFHFLRLISAKKEFIYGFLYIQFEYNKQLLKIATIKDFSVEMIKYVTSFKQIILIIFT